MDEKQEQLWLTDLKSGFVDGPLGPSLQQRLCPVLIDGDKAQAVPTICYS